MSEPIKRIAMWSGPRNISTALMRAWGNRDDTVVCDEPLYAHYLLHTGKEHPGRKETLAMHPTDWRAVARWLTEDTSHGKAVFYQKHMAHHLLPHIDDYWLRALHNCFLIRHPEEMVTSLAEKLDDFDASETGLPQQAQLFDAERRRTGRTPIVIDAKDMLMNPRGVLTTLCKGVGVPLQDSMLSWAPGVRETDGAWAPYWYRGVLQSTTFQPYEAKEPPTSKKLQKIVEECLPFYQKLHDARIKS